MDFSYLGNVKHSRLNIIRNKVKKTIILYENNLQLSGQRTNVITVK